MTATPKKVKILLNDTGGSGGRGLFLISTDERNPLFLWRNGEFHGPAIGDLSNTRRMTLISADESGYFETIEEAIKLCNKMQLEYTIETMSGKLFIGIIPEISKSTNSCNCSMQTLMRTGCVCGGN